MYLKTILIEINILKNQLTRNQLLLEELKLMKYNMIIEFYTKKKYFF